MNLSSSQLILVVEDSDDDYEATERALKRDGDLSNPLLRFDNGEDALSYLLNAGCYERTPPPPRPGIILLDLNLPGGGGVVALTRIKSHPELARIPIVILTTSEDPRDIERCCKAGADTYISKQLVVELLLPTIERLASCSLEFEVVREGCS
jgi:CheY-like chemotaxis protein